MRNTSMNKQDREFMKLRDQVFRVIPSGTQNGKKWRAFREYMDFYYKKVPSFEKYIDKIRKDSII